MDMEIISIYTRAQAIKDGVLVDVTETAKEAGFRWPVAVTQALWADICIIPEGSCQDVQGRLWDVVWMGRMAASMVKDGREFTLYKLVLTLGRKRDYVVKMVCGPGDDGEPVITLMQKGED